MYTQYILSADTDNLNQRQFQSPTIFKVVGRPPSRDVFGHVTLDSPFVLSYMLCFVSIPISCTVMEIWSLNLFWEQDLDTSGLRDVMDHVTIGSGDG